MSLIQHGRLRIHFAALADPLAKQVANCGLQLNTEQAELLQSCARSIVLLHVHGILSEGERHKANQRLFKAISRSVSAASNGNGDL